MCLSAIVGGLVTGGAALLGSKKNSKAIKQASQAQADSTAQQIAYQREADTRNQAALSPFMTRGNQAGDTIMAALGLGGSVTPPQAYAPSGSVTSPYTGANPAALAAPGNPYSRNAGYHDAWPLTGGGLATQDLPLQAVQQQSPAQAATNAYELFKQSTGYTSRLEEGFRGLNASYAGRGVLQSGAAVKSALRYGQDYASREFGNWLGALGNQQGLGFGAASALAGVSQGSADRLGQISQNAADNASNASIARAQNQSALWSGLAGAAGTAAGALSSYRRPTTGGWGNPALY